ncbi:hypothetical protein HK100_003055 [Physocladia obscura]|uniref:Myb-like domain-containing protein n=1 Tax=Physocladia obscura TaxID=109957 RepID=A0AAD5SWN5_9FUNG|nr:hypothetical protein HK100_003055 [Physocladia obscura]
MPTTRTTIKPERTARRGSTSLTETSSLLIAPTGRSSAALKPESPVFDKAKPSNLKLDASPQPQPKQQQTLAQKQSPSQTFLQTQSQERKSSRIKIETGIFASESKHKKKKGQHEEKEQEEHDKIEEKKETEKMKGKKKLKETQETDQNKKEEKVTVAVIENNNTNDDSDDTESGGFLLGRPEKARDATDLVHVTKKADDIIIGVLWHIPRGYRTYESLIDHFNTFQENNYVSFCIHESGRRPTFALLSQLQRFQIAHILTLSSYLERKNPTAKYNESFTFTALERIVHILDTAYWDKINTGHFLVDIEMKVQMVANKISHAKKTDKDDPFDLLKPPSTYIESRLSTNQKTHSVYDVVDPDDFEPRYWNEKEQTYTPSPELELHIEANKNPPVISPKRPLTSPAFLKAKKLKETDDKFQQDLDVLYNRPIKLFSKIGSVRINLPNQAKAKDDGEASRIEEDEVDGEYDKEEHRETDKEEHNTVVTAVKTVEENGHERAVTVAKKNNTSPEISRAGKNGKKSFLDRQDGAVKIQFFSPIEASRAAEKSLLLFSPSSSPSSSPLPIINSSASSKITINSGDDNTNQEVVYDFDDLPADEQNQIEEDRDDFNNWQSLSDGSPLRILDVGTNDRPQEIALEKYSASETSSNAATSKKSKGKARAETPLTQVTSSAFMVLSHADPKTTQLLKKVSKKADEYLQSLSQQSHEYTRSTATTAAVTPVMSQLRVSENLQGSDVNVGDRSNSGRTQGGRGGSGTGINTSVNGTRKRNQRKFDDDDYDEYQDNDGKDKDGEDDNESEDEVEDELKNTPRNRRRTNEDSAIVEVEQEGQGANINDDNNVGIGNMSTSQIASRNAAMLRQGIRPHENRTEIQRLLASAEAAAANVNRLLPKIPIGRKRWTEDEIAALMEGMVLYGSAWSKIERVYGRMGNQRLRDRNQIDLKDKARNEAKRRVKLNLPLGIFSSMYSHSLRTRD